MNEDESVEIGGTGQQGDTLSHHEMAGPCPDKPDLKVQVAGRPKRSDLPSDDHDRLPCPLRAEKDRQPSGLLASAMNDRRMVPLHYRDEPFHARMGVPFRIQPHNAATGTRAAA